MFLKPRMFIFIIALAFMLLGSISGLIVGVAGLVGGKWLYAALGFGIFAVCWSGKTALDRRERQVRRMINQR